VRNELDDWLTAAAIDGGRLFRKVSKADTTWGESLTEKAVWHIVKETARGVGVPKLAPHDLRRTCARLCHASGGELEQIQFLLGHMSVQTTERYLGCKQRIRSVVNDHIGIEPATYSCKEDSGRVADYSLITSYSVRLLLFVGLGNQLPVHLACVIVGLASIR
jgi:hypothetical protein